MKWWKRFFGRARMEEDLDRELGFHFDQHVADLIARGIAPEQAARQARLEFGGRHQVKEECRDARGTRWAEDLWQDSRHALRMLRQNPGFAAVTILTLALGTGATSIMFTVVNSVLLRPLAYTEPERLIVLHVHTSKIGDAWGFSYPDFVDFRRESRSLARIAAWTYGGGTIGNGGETLYVTGREISAELFPALGITAALGRAFVPEEDRAGAARVVLLSYRLWQNRFGGNASVIGTPLIFEGKPYTIVGVAPASFSLEGEADVFLPIAQDTEPRMRIRAARFLHIIARLRPGASRLEAQAELDVIARRLAASYPASNENLTITVHPLSEELVGKIQPTLWILLGAVGVLLSIACVNVASLLMARAVSRERELAMRAALGAGRPRLIQQCLTESTILALMGGLAGVVLALFGTAPFVALWPGGLPREREIHVDWRVLLFALGVSMLSGILFGLAPALRRQRDSLEHVLRSGTHHLAAGSRHLQSALVSFEIALAVVLLFAAGLLGRTVVELAALDPGVDVRNVLTARVAFSPAALVNPAATRAAWRNFVEHMRRIPGTRNAALADIIPMRVGENVLEYSASPAASRPNEAPLALTSTVGPDYLDVMHIALLHGRFFTDGDLAGATPVVVIDENLARHAFGRTDVIGKRLWSRAIGPAPLLIIGVVGHVRHWGLAGDDRSRIQDQMYISVGQIPDQLLHFFSSVMSVAIRTEADPLNLLEAVQREARSGGATLYDVHTMQQLVRSSLDRQRFLVRLFGVFAALALLLACVGIYGVMSYLTRERVREIGVRMALGATAREVVHLILRRALVMVAAGATAGVLAGLAGSRLLTRFVEGMRPAEPVVFATTVAVLMISALAASFLPARRASRIDPVKALRQA